MSETDVWVDSVVINYEVLQVRLAVRPDKKIYHLCCHMLTHYITNATYAYSHGVRIGCFKAGGSLATLYILGGVGSEIYVCYEGAID